MVRCKASQTLYVHREGKKKKSGVHKEVSLGEAQKWPKRFSFWEREGKTKPKWKLTKDNGNEEHELELSANMLRFLGLRNENENKRRHMHALHSSVGYVGYEYEVHCSGEERTLDVSFPWTWHKAGRARNAWKEVNENNWQGSAFICFPKRVVWGAHRTQHFFADRRSRTVP